MQASVLISFDVQPKTVCNSDDDDDDDDDDSDDDDDDDDGGGDGGDHGLNCECSKKYWLNVNI